MMNRQEWDKKAEELGGPFLQSWDWGEFQEAVGSKVNRFSGPDWLAQVVEHGLVLDKKYWYVPRGPIGNALAAAERLQKEAEPDRSLVFLRLEPQQPLSLPPATKDVQPKENWFVGLEGSEEEMLLSMKPKHRYNLNLAARKGITVRQASVSDFLSVWQLLLETARRGRFQLHSQDYYLQMWRVLPADRLKVFAAEFQGRLLACAFVAYFNRTATYLHGGSSDKDKQLMAPYLLHWEIMKDAKRRGYYNYDLGGVTSDPSHAWAGISRFKRGFGGFEVRYPGAYDQVLSPLWYNVYKNARKLTKLLRK